MVATRWLTTHRGVALLAVLLSIAVASAGIQMSRTADHASANPATGFVSVTGGVAHTCGLTSAGGVKCWGLNNIGQLGTGSDSGPQSCTDPNLYTYACSTVPVDVFGLTSGVVAVAAGGYHTCALTDTGGLKCWGSNYNGVLGTGSSTGPETCTYPGNSSPCSTSPVDVSGLTSGVAAVAGGLAFTCAATTAGSVKCWGDNSNYQSGPNCTGGGFVRCSSPVDVPGLTSVVALAAGDAHACALNVSGAVKCWGYGGTGELGNGTTPSSSSSPVDVTGLSSGVAAIAAGSNHACAVITLGGAKCWGRANEGQLGATGTGFLSSTPVNVTGLTSGVSKIAAGGWHSCAILTSGGAKCWGMSSYGEVGDGTATVNRSTPVDVVGLSGGGAGIATGRYHSCAVQTSGGVACWGINHYGDLGDGTNGIDYCQCHRTPMLVVESVPKPTTTPTPCPTEGCPTPTETPTPTPNPGSAGLDFSIGVTALDGAGETCDSSGTPASVCSLPLGATFKVSVYLHSLPTAMSSGYTGFDGELQYSDLTAIESKSALHLNYWPGCAKPAPNFSPGSVSFGCATGVGQPPSTYKGRMAAPEFTCNADGTVSLMHGYGRTDLVDDNGYPFAEQDGASESLTIHCVPPQAYPGDTDGDGCPDQRELGMNQVTGGRRNFLNPWDYFDPTHNGQIRIDDIQLVVHQYHQDSGSPAYNVDTDRTYVGPNPWSLGPPNGQQRIDDILSSVHEYHHDCL